MAMDNRSIAAFFKQTKQEWILLYVRPEKVRGKKNVPTLNILQEKGADQGKEVGVKSTFSLRVIETTGKHVAC